MNLISDDHRLCEALERKREYLMMQRRYDENELHRLGEIRGKIVAIHEMIEHQLKFPYESNDKDDQALLQELLSLRRLIEMNERQLLFFHEPDEMGEQALRQKLIRLGLLIADVSPDFSGDDRHGIVVPLGVVPSPYLGFPLRRKSEILNLLFLAAIEIDNYYHQFVNRLQTREDARRQNELELQNVKHNIDVYSQIGKVSLSFNQSMFNEKNVVIRKGSIELLIVVPAAALIILGIGAAVGFIIHSMRVSELEVDPATGHAKIKYSKKSFYETCCVLV